MVCALLVLISQVAVIVMANHVLKIAIVSVELVSISDAKNVVLLP